MREKKEAEKENVTRKRYEQLPEIEPASIPPKRYRQHNISIREVPHEEVVFKWMQALDIKD